MPEVIGFIINGETHSISVPDGSTQMLIDAVCAECGYEASEQDESGEFVLNPISRTRFVTVKIREFCQEIMRKWRRKGKTKTAVLEADAEVDAVFDLVEYL